MKYNKYGTLSYNDNGEYEIDGLNISKILHKIFYDTVAHADLPVVCIKIENNSRMLVNETGELYLNKNKFGIYSWFVNEIDIESILFGVVDEVIDITINV